MEANDASLGSGDATTRAQELRASLGARQDAEALLAEAGRVRQDAALAADAMVEEAQQLSAQLVAESRSVADLATNDARSRADGIMARARIEAEEVAERARATADAIRTKAESDIEDHRRRVRAEVTAQVTRDLTEQHRIESASAREQSDALISDLEASVRILGVSLESALANVSELLGSLEGLRSPAGPRPAHLGNPEVGTPAPPTSVPSATSQFGTVAVADAVVEADTDVDTDADPDEEAEVDVDTQAEEAAPSPDRPRSATEAFLSSSSLEVEQASRELRELQDPDETRRRRSDESRRAAQRRELDEGLSDDEDPDPEGARPLGWLFRSAQ